MDIRTEGVQAVLGGSAILKGVDIQVGQRELVGIIGPNGSGKSTLLKCIYRVLKPTGGAVLLAELLAAKAIWPDSFVSRRFAESGGYFETTCLPGVRHSLVTPMYPDGRVNYSALRQLIEYQIQHGADALFCAAPPARPPAWTIKSTFWYLPLRARQLQGVCPSLPAPARTIRATPLPCRWRQNSAVQMPCCW